MSLILSVIDIDGREWNQNADDTALVADSKRYLDSW